MLVDENKYNWSKWTQPVFDSNETWGTVSASTIPTVSVGDYAPYKALDGNVDTHWEVEEKKIPATFTWVFAQPLKIYRIELINKKSDGIDVTSTVDVFADEEQTQSVASGVFPKASQSQCDLEPTVPVACDRLVFLLDSYSNFAGLAEIHLVAEVGEEKTVLLPFLNTTEGMDAISTAYNDDGLFSSIGLEGFYFNGIISDPLYVSSNHWIGFGSSNEQLQVMRRDGCSKAIYTQLGETSNGLAFRKIHFEGYTVYNNRVEANRLIFELFLLSNNDMFLNLIQTPTSGNTGTSQLVCNGQIENLTLCDGSGGGCYVSFYHQDAEGKTWDIQYAMYEDRGLFSHAYLLRQGDNYYTLDESGIREVPVDGLTAATFLKYGFVELPASEVLIGLSNPEVYFWKAGGEAQPIKAIVKAYPFPSMITSSLDMSHISILGIKLMTAEYSGEVGVMYSLDGGAVFSEEMPLSDWLNTDPDELWNSLNENRLLVLRFVLYDNATISRFKITYIN